MPTEHLATLSFGRPSPDASEFPAAQGMGQAGLPDIAALAHGKRTSNVLGDIGVRVEDRSIQPPTGPAQVPLAAGVDRGQRADVHNRSLHRRDE